MKIRTRNDLIQAIDDDFSWRRIEIATLKNMLQEESRKVSTRRNKYKINCLIKSLVCISYSHWEGFAKQSSRLYLEYVKYLALDNSKLSSNLKASIVAHLRNNIPLIERISNYRKIFSDPNIKLNLPIDELTSTHDNLTYNYLEELALHLDIEYSVFATKKLFIDNSLLNYRNKFAHGEANYEVDENGAITIADETISLIDMFRTELQNMVALEKYKV